MHRLLRWLVGPDLFENILGDLEEQARSRWPHSRARLAIWMQIQVAGVIISAIRERTRRSGEGAPMQPLRRGGAMVAGRFLSNRQHDLAFAARLLLKERAFSATAFVTLALCIGANTAMFSIVRSIVLNPLPVPDADRLVVFRNEYPNAGVTRGATSVPDYFDRLALTDAFESFALYQRDGATVGGTHGARRVTLLRATPSFYDMVAAVPALGRGFGADPAGAPGGANEIVLSHAMWTDEFGGVAEAVGQDRRLNGVRKRSGSCGTTSTSSRPHPSPRRIVPTRADTATTGR
jgi:hypothetical protein